MSITILNLLLSRFLKSTKINENQRVTKCGQETKSHQQGDQEQAQLSGRETHRRAGPAALVSCHGSPVHDVRSPIVFSFSSSEGERGRKALEAWGNRNHRLDPCWLFDSF